MGTTGEILVIDGDARMRDLWDSSLVRLMPVPDLVLDR